MPAPQSIARLFHLKKSRGEKIAMISLYDAPSAQLACDGGADVLLVGDSMGNVVLGYDSTLPVTLDDMARATGAVARGVKSSTRPDVPVIADLPLATYTSPESAVQNAAVLLRAGASAVKLEGAGTRTLSCCEALREAGIAIVGHLGYTPQAHFALRGVVQGRETGDAYDLLNAANALLKVGACGIVLEAIALQVAATITRQVPIATIGIGSGPDCDGQVLVWHDLVGLTPDPPLRFVKRYAHLRQEAQRATTEFVREVQSGAFPQPSHGWEMPPDQRAVWDTSGVALNGSHSVPASPDSPARVLSDEPPSLDADAITINLHALDTEDAEPSEDETPANGTALHSGS